jgi:ubiquinone/menaquinone biosynthesis C-methylase UbiE
VDITSEKIKAYWNAVSCGTNRTEKAKFSRQYFDEIESFRYQHEPYIQQFAEFDRWTGKDILEVGVGAGTDFSQFVKRGANGYGVDLTEEAIANTSRRLEVYGLSAEELRVCNAETLPFEDDKFDLVYSWGVIHHAEHMEAVFDEIYRVTKPGGHIKIMVYNLNSTHAWYRCFVNALPKGKIRGGRKWAIYHYQESFATKAYTSREISKMVKQYPHKDLQFYFWDQRIRNGAHFEYLRRLIQSITPTRMRWHMAFEFTKIEES